MWNEIAEHINAATEGPRKCGQEWAKVNNIFFYCIQVLNEI